MGKRTDPDAAADAFAIADRRTRVAELYLRGTKQNEIAVRLDVHPGTISRDLQAIQHEWMQQRVAQLDIIRAMELQKIDSLERNAWAAWESSKQVKEIKRAKLGKKKDGEQVVNAAEITTEQRDGNPRFLQVVLQCLERRAKLLGLDAPTKIAQTDSQGNDILTPEQARNQYISIIAVLRDRAGEAAAIEGAGGSFGPDAG